MTRCDVLDGADRAGSIREAPFTHFEHLCRPGEQELLRPDPVEQIDDEPSCRLSEIVGVGVRHLNSNPGPTEEVGSV